MKILRTLICAALLAAGLCGCDKQLIPEINLADNLEGSWEKVYPEGVQDAGLVIWDFKAGDADPQTWILSIYVSDVFTGDSEAKYISTSSIRTAIQAWAVPLRRFISLNWIMTSSKRTGKLRIRLLWVTGSRSAVRTSWCLSALR